MLSVLSLWPSIFMYCTHFRKRSIFKISSCFSLFRIFICLKRIIIIIIIIILQDAKLAIIAENSLLSPDKKYQPSWLISAVRQKKPRNQLMRNTQKANQAVAACCDSTD